MPVPEGVDLEAELGKVRLVPTSWGDGALALAVGGEESKEPSEWFLVKLDLEREILREDVRPRYTFESGAVEAGPLRTDAHFAHVWREGVKVGFSATVLTGFHWNNSPVFEVPLSTFGLQLDGEPDRESRAKWRLWEQTFSER